jgi:hypothetical protein
LDRQLDGRGKPLKGRALDLLLEGVLQRKLQTALPITSGALLLLASSEAFLRFAQIPSVKVVALILALLAVVAIAWPGGGGVGLVLRGVAGFAFVVFAVQAAWRYPGLLKVEGSELDRIDVAILALEAGLLFGFSVALANWVLRGAHRSISGI